jgi:uncharacterized protein (TIGR00156 family)
MRESRVVAAAAAALFTCCGVVSASADYRGPRAAPDTNVGQILQNPKDDLDVVLQGRIVRQVRSERYVFTDGTGEIEIKIDDKRFPAEPIDDKIRVEITGEIEKDFRKPAHIDVDAVRVLGNEP